ncbi:RNA ligase (ATP) [Nannocystis bainbridge]|uniref:RNA ligase (ATP) n=1 Tax=Nannocystis bainbridge TaxID=2995303 RepID=A0ABT5E199_9BACT|nr:RNA ligase (ATP) [Nannocystis bainbridge]MDC0718758.1 RNA ligase (ATP) [Nannocystis bainbridge]
MSSFAVHVVRVAIEPHDNADSLEIARVGDYRSIVRKGQFTSGELVAYIPEQAIVPDPLLDELGLRGRLSGKDTNRVKAIKLRGVLSQGLVYPARPTWSEGQDVTAELGILKYEPAVPSHMNGHVYGAGPDRCVKYDIENVKAFPDVLVEGEPVVFTEKIHGTWCQLGLVPNDAAGEHGPLIVSSKGLAAKGLAFTPAATENQHNLYLRVARHLDFEARAGRVFAEELAAGRPVFVLGEVFGAGVQDLAYGSKTDQDRHLGFRVFDIYTGWYGQGGFLSDADLQAACSALELPRVPVLYRGPFNRATMAEHTDGRETVSGQALHVREGIVLRPQLERRHPDLGRVQLKSVSEKYLLRSGGTEYN